MISPLIDALDSIESALCFHVFSLDGSTGPAEPEESKKGSVTAEPTNQSRGPLLFKDLPQNSAVKE